MNNKIQSKSVQKRLAVQQTAKPAQRYRLLSDDSGHEYFVEVGMEGEFDLWLGTEEGRVEADGQYYANGGYDYDKNRIDGRFTFTNPSIG